jgi:hypothetical protein
MNDHRPISENWPRSLDVEERLGATDPLRQLGQLAHLILRTTPTAAADRAG